MDKKLQHRLDLLVENTAAVKKEYVMPHTLVKQMAALLYTAENRPMDAEYLRQCHNIIKEGTGVLSIFRGDMAVALSAMLALSGNPETRLENALEVYDLMKQAKFRRSDFLTFAAFEIASKAEPRYYEETVARAAAFYRGMKRNRWWITGEDDYIYAAMLALSDLDVNEGVAHVETLHKLLKPEMRYNANSLQALSQVMAVSNTPDATAERVLQLRSATAALGIRMDKQYTMSSLGILALLPGSTEEIAAEIKESHDYLRGQKGFGYMSNTKQALLLLSAALVAAVRGENARSDLVNSTISTNFNNILIAQYTSVLVATVIITSSAASSSASG